jgi:penicillin amidase
MWQGFIPQPENPHAKNPERGFLQSANQRPADSTYPYFIPGSYITARGITIENKLAAMSGITVNDMMALHGNYFNTLAEDARTVLLKYTKEGELNTNEKKYLDLFRNWDLQASADSKGQTIYSLWRFALEDTIWGDDFAGMPNKEDWPETQTLFEYMLRDSAMKFADDIRTPAKESLYDMVTAAFKKTASQLTEREKTGLEWYKFNQPGVYHIMDKSKKDLLPFARAGLHVGGWGDIVNAIKGSHGPSWRMIVQMSSPTEAYGVYPGGQSGNPGSRFYDNYLDQWAEGKYNKLWFMRDGDRTDKNVKWVMKFKGE